MIPFNRPHATGREFGYIQEAIDNLHLSGNGPFAERCVRWLRERTGCEQALLTPSGSAALEMAALVLGLEPGDEVIMPSFTFVTTASAVVLRGGVPVFVEIRPDTLTMDPAAVAAAITPRTKAIFAVHYAGVACDLDELERLAREAGIVLVEDAAQGVMSTYADRPLGSIGSLGCLSFHETKNVISGEGGALLVNREELVGRAELIQDKGTDRRRFFRGEVDHYTWVELGSSFLMSEVNAAFLWAQLEAAEDITADRMRAWRSYHERLEPLERRGALRRPSVPEPARHNAHMYYVVLPDRERRDRAIAHLADAGIMAVFHYVPLHSSPAGRRYGRVAGALPVTDAASDGLLRLPLWVGIREPDIELVSDELATAVG